jgi:hypothetical protein
MQSKCRCLILRIEACNDCYTRCPNRYRTRHFFNNFTTNEDIRRTTDTFLFISYTMNIPLFKFLCNIFIGVGIIKEMPGSLASGTHCAYLKKVTCFCVTSVLCWDWYEGSLFFTAVNQHELLFYSWWGNFMPVPTSKSSFQNLDCPVHW